MEQLFPQRSGADKVPKQVEDEKIVVHAEVPRRSSLERVDKLLADRDAGKSIRCVNVHLILFCRNPAAQDTPSRT